MYWYCHFAVFYRRSCGCFFMFFGICVHLVRKNSNIFEFICLNKRENSRFWLDLDVVFHKNSKLFANFNIFLLKTLRILKILWLFFWRVWGVVFLLYVKTRRFLNLHAKINVKSLSFDSIWTSLFTKTQSFLVNSNIFNKKHWGYWRLCGSFFDLFVGQNDRNRSDVVVTVRKVTL